MYLPTAEEMAFLDRRAAEEFGVSTLLLMEAAGRSVAEAARRLVGREVARAVVVAGKGNNGGDGFVASRVLLAAGWRVTVVLLARDSELAGDAALNLQAARRAGVEVVNLDSTAVPGLRGTLAAADVVVDALFGTGFRGPAVGLAAKTIEAMNACGRPVLSVDIPSGVMGDSGAVDGVAVRAAATVTMGLPKIGLILPPGAEHAGRIWLADVGHPRRLLEAAGIRTRLVTREMVDTAIRPRRLDAHKGDFGRVLVVAGSVGHSGAAVLAAQGALRAGAGLVTLAVPAAIYPVVGPAVIEGMPVPLPDQDGALAAEAAGAILDLAASADAVACGPGLSTLPGPAVVVRRLVAECATPMVLDADALNLMAASGDWPAARGPLVLTPHPGEMARLLQAKTEDIQRHRLQVARVAAERLRAVVVLKGARTVVADPAGDVFVVPTGNPAMATGGMGDVLAGVIAALIGQDMAPMAAAWAGAYLHGLAGDQVAAARGPAGILAREVADALPAALAAVRAGSYAELVTPLLPP
ncbi:MAG: NAD(P)H-hydrate dehydratase [Armatimonadota bacterium]|nr:NAD(P)H-hydrate dehydratase [Armatimonadota bacterium]MDR7518874.1 NAD(P)H-hydrate dehydratase [Armatimonadota bacterium]MDR7549103.1 NAD(P)H-hydrate dehydratase [Armatimonadota bacterium]